MGDGKIFRNQIKKGLSCNAKEFEFYPVTLSDSWNGRELFKLPLAKSKKHFFSAGHIVLELLWIIIEIIYSQILWGFPPSL